MMEHGFPEDATAKIVRHADTRPGMDLDMLERGGWIETYQSYQAKRIFECDYVVTFIGIADDRARFFGVYRVNGTAELTPVGKLPLGFPHPEFDSPGGYYYNLQYDESFDILDGLAIDWGTRPINWHLWLADNVETREFNIVESIVY